MCLDHKNLDVALDIANVGVTRLPKSDKLRLQKAIVLATRGDFEPARVAFTEAAELARTRAFRGLRLVLFCCRWTGPMKRLMCYAAAG